MEVEEVMGVLVSHERECVSMHLFRSQRSVLSMLAGNKWARASEWALLTFFPVAFSCASMSELVPALPMLSGRGSATMQMSASGFLSLLFRLHAPWAQGIAVATVPMSYPPTSQALLLTYAACASIRRSMRITGARANAKMITRPPLPQYDRKSVGLYSRSFMACR